MTDLRKLLIEARAWIVANEKHESVCPTRVMGTWGRCRCGFVSIIGRIDAALAEKVEPVAWIEHHKAGDNLNWERVDHSYAKATPLYAAPQSDDRAGMLRDEVMSLYDAEIAKGGSADFERADQNALAAFDPRQPEAMVADPRVGRWTLTSPDGRMFFGDSQLAALREERNSRMSAAEQLENIRKGMEAESQPDTVAVPIHQLEHWAEYWNGSANEKAMSDALEHILGEVDDLLRAAQEAK